MKERLPMKKWTRFAAVALLALSAIGLGHAASAAPVHTVAVNYEIRSWH